MAEMLNSVGSDSTANFELSPLTVNPKDSGKLDQLPPRSVWRLEGPSSIPAGRTIGTVTVMVQEWTISPVGR